jgi:hypothetical protein
MNKQLILSFIISFTFLSLGFLLLHYELIGYGLSFFVFLPFIIGYILGKPLIKRWSLIGLTLSLFIFFILLLAGGLEGMVCILMCFPLILVAIAIGIIVGSLTKRKGNDKLLKSSIVPLGVFLVVAFLETELTRGSNEVVSIQTEIVLPYSTLQVYDAIKSVDTLIAEKTFLMKLDLPVPQKCILENEKVGGIRTCYFSGGTITERVTQLEKGKVLKMDVIDYKLTGRKWLGFKEAIYYFQAIDSTHSKLTRITTYTSELKPRLYWKPLEKMGISQEHEYVFENLKRDLKRQYGR